MVTFRGARVHVKDFFRNLRGDSFARGNIREHFAIYFACVIFNFLSFRGDGLLGLAQRDLGALHIFFRFFSGHHLIELSVFRFRNFHFSVGNFVQQRFVGFIGFYGRGLPAEFLCALAPFCNFEFCFPANRNDLRERVFR